MLPISMLPILRANGNQARIIFMSKEKSFEEIVSIIERCDDLDPLLPVDSITPETHFQEDLGFDSLALMSILYELQEAYPGLDETEINDWHRVKNCVASLKCQNP